MSRLETDVQTIVRPLFKGIATNVTTDQQFAIARWTLKTAILYEFAIDRSPRYYKPRDRTAFFEARLIPPDTFVYLGHYVDPLAISTASRNTPLIVWPNTPQATSMDGYTTTFTLHQLALQVFSFRRPDDYRGSISIKIPGGWHRAHIEVCPIRGNRSWPPPEAFDEEGLKLFASRWSTVTS